MIDRRDIAFAVFTLAFCVSCPAVPQVTQDPCIGPSDRLQRKACTMPKYPKRSYDVYLPPTGKGPFPVIFAVHGGGGNRRAAIVGTCPNGDEKSPQCLHRMANKRGYVVVSADGTKARFGNFRSWNGGGGNGNWRCTGGRACDEKVDELAYFRALLEHLGARVNIDPNRLYVTGLSNGGTMSHRLACQLEGVKAVVPIGGTMQWTTGEVCKPPKPVAVLHAHGTEDKCWPYVTGPTQCPIGKKDKDMKGVDDTMKEWAAILGCKGKPSESKLPDTDKNDLTRTTKFTWPGCSADLALLRIEGGGHTWPRGHQYLGERIVGRVARDWGNEVILDWFDSH